MKAVYKELLVGIVLIVVSLLWILYGSSMFIGVNWVYHFIITANAVIPVVAILIGALLIWLAYDEWKIEKELKAEEEKLAKEKRRARKK
ncbi:MAG: hypothetical protein RMJ17_02660 [Candidatus Aenigmarchaeota archaeon]|nr:hypothetical protein [Candidatus Aenigmarchaeota archaeon]MDW8149471.1 hypothetical protein [Candidatus Aenigmarchaeota archaeon]